MLTSKTRHRKKYSKAKHMEDYIYQGGKCAIVDCPRTKGFYGRALCVDHCHTTEELYGIFVERGLLCDWCNLKEGRLRKQGRLHEFSQPYLQLASLKIAHERTLRAVTVLPFAIEFYGQ